MNKQYWGKVDDKEVYLIRITDGELQAGIINYGGAVVSLLVPDRNGKMTDVVLGFDSLSEYEKQQYYLGVIVGRCANRIKNASFWINGEEYFVDKNEGNNHLHGGKKGFSNVVWDIDSYGEDFVILKYLSPDGDGGYPGNLQCTVTYRMVDRQLEIRYKGVSDKDTPMNLTLHSYFNLNGHGNGTIENHMASIAADRITEMDRESIPTGNMLPVEGTPFDLHKPERIGGLLTSDHKQMEYGNGFDINYVLNSREDQDAPAAELYSPASGIGMKVNTDMEGMHFYTGNYLPENLQGKNGKIYQKFGGLCFETQHYPNAVNIEHFPSPILKKGEGKQSRTVFEFYTAG